MESWGSVGLSNFRHTRAGGYPTILLQPKLGSRMRGNDGKVGDGNDEVGGYGVEIAWNFYIGGYQPAQKWLKDRKGRELSFDDIKHYQKIIKILSETDRIMKTIEMAL